MRSRLPGAARSLSRRDVLAMTLAGAATGLRVTPTRAQEPAPAFIYPMALPGRPPGDGFYVRIAYAAENAPYYPGWWHTGENWHRIGDDTARLGVFAVAGGEVVFAGFDYPGRVVVVQHAGGLYSMYGHLDDALAVETGQTVARGDLLGTVLARADDYARSHLHFEIRDFLIRDEINGDAPQHGVSCGHQCPPGPGYWPMAAPEHPSHLGWRNPTHVINRRAWPDGLPPDASVIVAESAPERVPLWSAPGDSAGAPTIGNIALKPGDRYLLLDIETGPEAATGTSAEATHLWYRISLPDGTTGWVQGAVPSAIDIGADGRPSSLGFILLPDAVMS